MVLSEREKEALEAAVLSREQAGWRMKKYFIR